MTQRGNVLIYVLIAIALFGALSFAISQNMESTASEDINEASVVTSVNNILSYSAAAQNAVEQMDMNGTPIDEIDFTMPGEAGFNTAPTINKLFHPDGGGFQYKPLPAAAIAPDSALQKYYIGRFNNTEWTPTTTQDVMFTAFGLKKEVCEALNQELTGSKTVPVVSSIAGYLVLAAYHTVTQANFTAAACPTCNERPAFCIFNGATNYAFYNILVAR